MAILASKNGLWLCVGFAALAVTGCSGGKSRETAHLEKGQTFLAAGNLEKARIEFRNALQIAPNDSEARYENGVVDEKLGNRREAAQFYQGAIEANADNVRARVGLGRVYLGAGAPEPALEAIKPAFANHPDDPGLLTVRAAAHSQLKDSAAALTDAERAVQLAPTDEDAVAVLADVYRLGNQPDKAIALLESSLKQVPDSVTLRLRLAQLYATHDQQPKAEALLVDLVRIQPTVKAHRIRLAQYYSGSNRIDEAEHVLRDGVQALPKERDLKTSLVELLAVRRSRESAEKQLQDFITQDPKDYELRFALARLYEQSKDVPKAEAVYHQVSDEAGLEAPGLTARDHLAGLLAAQGDAAGAQKLLAEVLEKAPHDDDALFQRANLALAQKDPKTAIGDLRSVLRDQPDSSGVMRVLARAHLANGEPALAEETMRRAADANPSDAAARLDLAQLLIDLGKPEQARPIVDDLVKQQPTNGEALNAQFKIAAASRDVAAAKAAANAIVATHPKAWEGYYDQGAVAELEQRPADAIRLYSTALDMEPVAIDPLRSLTHLLVQQKRLPEALHRLDDLAGRYPQSAYPLNLKGEALLSQKQTADAMVAFKSAIGREPRNPVSYRNLALAQAQSGDAAAAIATLQGSIDKVTTPEVLENSLASFYQQTGRPDQAIKVYEDALKLDPQSEAITNNLAMLLVDTKTDAASLQRAKQLAARLANSTNAAFLDTYGWVLYREGEAISAVPVLERASAKAPGLAEPWYHLGMAQAQIGQAEAAKTSLARSLQSGRPFEGIDEAKATLAKLGKAAPAELSPRS